MIALTRILVPTNLGAPSKAAVTYGVALARQFKAQLFVLHVLPEEDYYAAVEAERVVEALMPGALPESEPSVEPHPDAVVRNAAREGLQRLLDPEEEAMTRAEYVLRATGTGGPGEAITDAARELGIGLIVIGKHRLGLVEQLLAGSVTEKVVRQAPCPVLIVKYPEHEFVLPDDPGQAGED